MKTATNKYFFARKGKPKPQKAPVRIIHRDAEVFEEYFKTRSYKAVADKFGCNEFTVRKHAVDFDWPTRIQQREQAMRDETEKYVVNHFAEDQVSMYKTLTLGHRHVHNKLARSVDFTRNEYLEPEEVKECMDALDKIIRNKRLIAGEHTEKTALTMKDFMEELHARYERAGRPGTDGIAPQPGTVQPGYIGGNGDLGRPAENTQGRG